MGFFKQVTGNIKVDLEKNRIVRTMIKNFPVEYHAMSAIESALWIKNQLNGEEISKIHVDTFSVAHRIIVKDPEKLTPKSKSLINPRRINLRFPQPFEWHIVQKQPHPYWDPVEN